MRIMEKNKEYWRNWKLKSDGDRLRREQMVSAFCLRPSILTEMTTRKETERERVRESVCAGGETT